MDSEAGKPEVRFWPEADFVDVQCPWCGNATRSFIGIVKELGDGGRPDECDACRRDIIIEAHESGVAVMQAECKPLWP